MIKKYTFITNLAFHYSVAYYILVDYNICINEVITHDRYRLILNETNLLFNDGNLVNLCTRVLWINMIDHVRVKNASIYSRNTLFLICIQGDFFIIFLQS